jgi:hypothetical protein
MRHIITQIEIENLGDIFRIHPVYKPRGRKAGGYNLQRDAEYLTNSALVFEPKCWGRGRVAGVSANEYCCTQEPKKTSEI